MSNQEKPVKFSIKLTKLNRVDKKPFPDWLLKELYGARPEDTITTTHHFVLNITRTSLQGEEAHYKGVRYTHSFTPLLIDDKSTGRKKLTGEIGQLSTLDFGGTIPEWHNNLKESLIFERMLRRLLQDYFPEAEIYREE